MSKTKGPRVPARREPLTVKLAEVVAEHRHHNDELEKRLDAAGAPSVRPLARPPARSLSEVVEGFKRHNDQVEKNLERRVAGWTSQGLLPQGAGRVTR